MFFLLISVGSKERRVEKLSIVLVCTVHACRCMYFSWLLNSKSFAQIVTIFMRTLFIKGSKLKDWISTAKPRCVKYAKKKCWCHHHFTQGHYLRSCATRTNHFSSLKQTIIFPFFFNRYVWYIIVWLSL